MTQKRLGFEGTGVPDMEEISRWAISETELEQLH